MSALQDAQTANPDRYTGYTVTPSNEDNPNAQTSYSIVRDLDGTGLGAYAQTEQVEQIILADRHMIATLPKGTGYVPPLVAVTPSDPPPRELPPQLPPAVSEDDGLVQDPSVLRPEDQPYMVQDVFESMAAELAVSRLDVAQHKARATQAHRELNEAKEQVRVLLMENADLRDALAQAANTSA